MAIRGLLRNQQPVFYKLYEGQEEIIDAYGEPNRQLRPRLQHIEIRYAVCLPEQGKFRGGAVRLTRGLRPDGDYRRYKLPN